MNKDRVKQFYEAMNYPLPTEEVLQYLKRAEHEYEPLLYEKFQYEPQECVLFSWQEKQERMGEYVEFVQKFDRLWKSLPFITHIYLANSITFNALHDKSDIDLVCIVQKKRMRLARACSWLMLGMSGISRYRQRSTKKFCLSFYIEEKHTNLYNLLLQPLDIYMIFWLAHLVPLYCVQHKEVDIIWKTNPWLKGYFPNHPLKQIIRLGNTLVVGDSRIKTIIEQLLGGWRGNLLNRLIALIRKPILAVKKDNLGKKGRGIVISDRMLKFHGDKRKEYILKYMNKLKRQT